MHVFECDTVVKPAVSLGNPFCGFCCLRSCPFVVWFAVFLDEIVLVVCLWCYLVWFDLPVFMDLLCPCTNVVLTDYAHIRTEPQCDIAKLKKKKGKLSMQERCCLLKLCPFWQNDHCSNLIFGAVNTLAFGSNKWSFPAVSSFSAPTNSSSVESS